MIFKELFGKLLNEERGGGKVKNFDVIVGENEGIIPHFHLLNESENKFTAIRLDAPYYFLHGDKNYILNSKEKKELINWLNSSNINGVKTVDKNGILPSCNWENLRNSWNIMYSNNQVVCLKPDYSLLNKDYKDQK